MIKALPGAFYQATEEDGSSDEDLDDEAMMELDKGLATLFSEQKKKTQAKKDEKSNLLKEKSLVRDFKIKVRLLPVLVWCLKAERELMCFHFLFQVLDLVEVFVTRQAGSPLILSLIEPLLNIINKGISSGSNQQEQDFLRRVADIFR